MTPYEKAVKANNGRVHETTCNCKYCEMVRKDFNSDTVLVECEICGKHFTMENETIDDLPSDTALCCSKKCFIERFGEVDPNGEEY